MKIKRGKTSFKKEYVRILLNGPSGSEDYDLARELIDSGYATGKYRPSHNRENYNEALDLQWTGINTKGRLFADELQLQIWRQSLTYNAIEFAIWFSGWAIGVGTQILLTWYQCP